MQRPKHREVARTHFCENLPIREKIRNFPRRNLKSTFFVVENRISPRETEVFRRHHVENDPVNWIDLDGLTKGPSGIKNVDETFVGGNAGGGGRSSGGSGGSGGGRGGSGGGGSGGGGAGGAGGSCRNTVDQTTIINWAKDYKRTGISPSDARAMEQLAREANVPFRGPEVHPGRRHGQSPHYHIGPVDHIPVKGK